MRIIATGSSFDNIAEIRLMFIRRAIYWAGNEGTAGAH